VNPGNRRQIGWVGMVGKGGAVHTSLQSDIGTYTRATSAHIRQARPDSRPSGKVLKSVKGDPTSLGSSTRQAGIHTGAKSAEIYDSLRILDQKHITEIL